MVERKQRRHCFTIIGAEIIGYSIMVGHPLELVVQGLPINREPYNRLLEPFSALVPRVISMFTGVAVVLRGGILIPTDNLEDRERIVLVRLYPDQAQQLPTVDLSSLLRKRRIPPLIEIMRSS